MFNVFNIFRVYVVCLYMSMTLIILKNKLNKYIL